MPEVKGYLLVLNWSPSELGGCNVFALGLGGVLRYGTDFVPLIGVAADSRALPETIQGIPVHRVSLHNCFGESLRISLYVVRKLPMDLWKMYHFLRAHNIGVVHSVYPGFGSASLLLLRWLGLYRGSLVVSFHGMDIASIEQSNAWSRKLWKLYLERVDAVFCCSGSIRERVVRIAPGSIARVIFNGADVAAFRRPGIRPEVPPLRLLHVGKYVPMKAHDVLLAAFRSLLDRGIDAYLTMIGGSGPETAKIRSLASEFGPRVRMLVDVPHNQLPAYYAEANLFVLPSRQEAFGITLIEAGAAGLPVVATRVGGIPEFLTHGQTALLVEPDDPEALADAVARLASTTGLAESLAQQWHQKAMEFSWHRMTEQYLEGFTEGTQRSKRPT